MGSWPTSPRLSPCKGYKVDVWLASQSWAEPELTEPVAAASDQVPVRMLGCAQDRTATGDAVGAGILFREFLTGYPDHELAGEAATGIVGWAPTATTRSPTGTPPNTAVRRPTRCGCSQPGGARLPRLLAGDDPRTTRRSSCARRSEVGEFQESCQLPFALRRPPFGASSMPTSSPSRPTSSRAGKLVEDYTREIGNPCPNELDGTFNTIYFFVVRQPRSGWPREYTDADFRGLFADLVS